MIVSRHFRTAYISLHNVFMAFLSIMLWWPHTPSYTSKILGWLQTQWWMCPLNFESCRFLPSSAQLLLPTRWLPTALWLQVSVLKVDSDIPWNLTLGGVEMFIFSVFIPNTFLESNQLSQTRVPNVIPMLLGYWWLYSSCSHTRTRHSLLQLRSPGRESCPYRQLPRPKERSTVWDGR